MKPGRPAPIAPEVYDDTPLRGYSMPGRSMSPSSLHMEPDASLEASGLSGSAVQCNILRGRLQTSQGELAKARKELRDAMEKVTQMGMKLSEQKLENSSLLHKYNSVVGKLSTNDETHKELEEAILMERRSHATTKESFDRLKDQLRQKDEQIRAQTMLSEELEDKLRDAQSSSTWTRTSTVEVTDAIERCQRHQDFIGSAVAESMARLLDTVDDEDARLFVCKSEVQSTAQEIDMKLTTVEQQIERADKNLLLFRKELEDDTTKLIAHLMKENWELWSQLSHLQLELDKTRNDTKGSDRRQATGDNTQLEYLQQQNNLLEERLKKSQVELDVQIKTSKTHEENTAQLLEANQLLRQQIDALKDEQESASKAQQENLRHSKSMALQRDEVQSRYDDLQRENVNISKQVHSLTEQLRHAEDRVTTEARTLIRSIQNERDHAQEQLSLLRRDHDEAVERVTVLQKELDNRTAYFNQCKTTMEETQIANSKHLQDEITSQKVMFERELEDMRRELDLRSSEALIKTKECDTERALRLTAETSIEGLNAHVETLQKESEEYRESAEESEAKYQNLINDLDASRRETKEALAQQKSASDEMEYLTGVVDQQRVASEEEKKRHEAQLSTMEEHLKENESQRSDLKNEIRLLKRKLLEESEISRNKERWERDKEILQKENERLHKQGEEAKQANARLVITINDLRDKITNTSHVQEHLTELQRRLDGLINVRQQLEECQAENQRLLEEVEYLRKDRDVVAQRMEYFLEESRAAAVKDTDAQRVNREASTQRRRLDNQIDQVHNALKLSGRAASGIGASSRTTQQQQQEYNANAQPAGSSLRRPGDRPAARDTSPPGRKVPSALFH